MKKDEYLTNKEESLAELLKTRGDKYTTPIYSKSGGTRDMFESSWGPHNDIPVIVKVDRSNFQNSRAESHFHRGYNTKNELELMVGSSSPGIARVIDYFDSFETERFGISGTVVVEEKISGGYTLEEEVSNNGGLSFNYFNKIFLSGIKILNEKISGRENKDGIYHRDIKPSNWMVKDGESIIIDWANAIKKGDIEKSYMSTAGGRSFTDPKLMGVFVDKKSKYNDESEIYSTVGTMMYAIRGTPVFNCDPETGKAICWDTGETILSEGKIDENKYDRLLRDSLKKIPKRMRRYSDLLYRGMTLEESKRFSSYNEFYSEFKRLSEKKNLVSKLSKNLLIGSAVVLPFVGMFLYNNMSDKIEKSNQVSERNKKALHVAHYLSGIKNNFSDIIANGEISEFKDIFEDEKTAIAAYLDPDLVYEAIQEVGSSKFDSISRFLWEKNPDLSSKIDELTCQVIDSWMWQMDNDGRNKAHEHWDDAKRTYEEMHKSDSLFEKHNDISTLNIN